MAFTHLSPLALPGQTYAFTPKEAPSGVKSSDQVTALSVAALPGPLHSFLPKTPVSGVKGAGQFTWLSVMALPGMRHSFTAKEAAEVEEAVVAQAGGGWRPYAAPYRPDYRDDILREDKELMEFIAVIVKAGLLN